MAVYLSGGLFDALSGCLEFSSRNISHLCCILAYRWIEMDVVKDLACGSVCRSKEKYAYKNKVYIMPS